MKRESIKEDYKFTVERVQDWKNKGVYGYSVSMPHQCDAWEIIGAEANDDAEPCVEGRNFYPLKTTAIFQMELFIKRAQEALEELKKLD